MWFSATLSTNDEESKTIREVVIEASDAWPDYAQNMILILDYAAIIENRLFTNHHNNPNIDWSKESFRIWNSYAAAFRLGEVYTKYKKHLPLKDKDINALKAQYDREKPLIITEGKTDWMHLKNAYKFLKNKQYYPNLHLVFNEDMNCMGDRELTHMCKNYARTYHPCPVIFVAGADNPIAIAELTMPGSQYKAWGNNVFSFCIPKPPHRENYKNISIEFYYKDKDIKTIDPITKRRLLFTNEVKKVIVENQTRKKPCISFQVCPPIEEDETDKKIYDENRDKILDSTGKCIALSKAEFAENIYNHKDGFTGFDLEPFALIFDVIDKIINNTKTT